MMNIAIEYPFLFFIRKATGTVPTSWNELTERQFLAISRTVHGAEPDFQILSVLTGIGQRLLKKLHPYDLLKLTQGIDFVGNVGNTYSEFIIRKIHSTNLIAPKSKLGAMPFGQFIFADSYYNDWMATKDEKALNNLIATLYLEPGEKFTTESIPLRVLTIINIKLDTRKAIAFNYSLILMWLQKCYPLIFQQSIDDSDKVDGTRPKQSGWLKLFDSLVGEDLINRDRYADLPVNTVFRHLTNKYKENAKR